MKITRYRTGGNSKAVTILSIEKVWPLFTTETKDTPVSRLRESIKHTFAGIRCSYADHLPVFTFSGVFDRKPPYRLLQYNGVVLLEVTRLLTRKEVVQIRNKAASLPQTLAAFTGSGGKSVKILVRFSLPDGTLPQVQQQVELFHAEAYRQAVKWYEPQLNREIELKKPVLERGCRLTFDPAPYYNPEAAVIRIEQPLRMAGEEDITEKLDAMNTPVDRLLPGHERSSIIYTLYNEAFHAAYRKAQAFDGVKDLQVFFTWLAEHCLLSGIPEEEAIRWTRTHSRFHGCETHMRSCFHTAYIQQENFGKKPSIPPTMTLMATLDEFMQRRYRFRRNVMQGTVEYQEIRSFYFDFRPVDKTAMNSICMDAHSEGLEVWDADIRRYVGSNRIPVYNPVEEFLYNLPVWNGKDHIGELALRVPCNHPRWNEFFRTWFLSMVAHWLGMDKEHGNSTLPLLVGDQGCGKSTFCMNLLPHSLREYYTDSIDFSKRRDVELALNRFLLINMDEFDSISPSYQGFMKHIIQKAAVQTRLPYATATQQLRRYATFIATSNNFDLLTDPTGSRRFICVEITGKIDYLQPIEYEQLYAQALHLLRQGERYWFTSEEERSITASNRVFKRILPEEELVHTWFRAPEEGEAFQELTCGEMIDKITRKEPHRKFRQNMISALGKELKNAFVSRRNRRGTVYQVVEKGEW